MSFVQSQRRNFPAGWAVVPFDEALDDVTGGNAKVQTRDYLSEGALQVIDQGQSPVARYVNDASLACKAPLPCVLFGDHTRIFKFVDSPFALGADGVKVLAPRAGLLDAKFAFHYLQTVRLPEDLGYSRHFKYLREAIVPLPPLPEQRRIADILDKADAIRRKRKEAIALTEELLRSAFLEMFGDPVTNPKGWPVSTLGNESSQMKYGTSEKCGAQSPEALAVLRIPNVVGGRIDWVDLKYARLEEREVEALRMQRGDLLFVRSNGNPDYIGRCAVYDSDRVSLYASYLIRVRLNAGRLHPVYVRSALSAASYRARLTAAARTTAGNYNISTEGLRRLPLPLPPFSEQVRFAEFDAAARQSSDRLKLAAQHADDVFAALTQQLFNTGGLG